MMRFTISDVDGIDYPMEKFCGMLRESGIDDDGIFRAKLASVELLSNVFRHGDGEAEFCGDISDGTVIITVTGGNPPAQPVLYRSVSLPDVNSESGRGLYLVSRYCGGRIEVDGSRICVKIKI